MTLYDLTTEIAAVSAQMDAWAEAHDGDITDFPLAAQLEAAEADRDAKLLSIGAWVKNIEAEADAIKAEASALTARARSAQGRADRLRAYAATAIEPGRKLSDSRVAYSWRKSVSVSIDADLDPATLPDGLKRVTIEPDKTAIKTAITAGHVVPGAKLTEKMNLQIK
jgi:hypothetical protein